MEAGEVALSLEQLENALEEAAVEAEHGLKRISTPLIYLLQLL